MREIELYAGLRATAERQGFLLARLQDAAGMAPFDLFGVVPPLGIAVGIEVKVDRRMGFLSVEISDRRPMPASWWDGRPHQLAWLRDLANVGGYALIMVCKPGRGVHKRNWTMYRVPPGLTGDLRMLPLGSFDKTELPGDLEGWLDQMRQSDDRLNIRRGVPLPK